MVDRRPFVLFPIQLTGTPVRVAQWLRAAGVPTAEFSSGTVAEGRADVPAAQGPLLFDSRTAASRADAQRAAVRGWKTIDVARLLAARETDPADDSHVVLFDDAPPTPTPRSQRRDFLEGLKQEIEAICGVWARIADYPFPYRSAVIEYRSSAELAVLPTGEADPLPARPEHDRLNAGELLDAYREHYAAGRPFLVSSGDDTAGDPFVDALFESGDFPLAWRTTPKQFADWRAAYAQLPLRLRTIDSRCEIESQFDPRGLQPALEIWRGSHVASIPLTQPHLSIELGGLVFQQNAGRHPAGLAADSAPFFSMETIRNAKAAG